MYGLALIAIIAVMGGIIAYIGDKLGTKVGKKKLSMFGLRPKHTSIIVTIITGILISATTLGLMTAISWDVRTALFGMEALKTELVFLNTEVDTKSAELEISRAALETRTAEYEAISGKVAETAARLAAITAELSQVTAQRDKAAIALKELQSDYSLAQRDLAKYQNDIKNLQLTKNELESDIDRLNKLTKNLTEGLQIVREGTVIFRTGEVLSTAVINGGGTPEEIAVSLGESIYRTNQLILDKLDVTDRNLELLWIARSEFDQAVAQIAENKQDVIVRVSAAGNTVYGEMVIGRLELFPNRLVYSKGSVVYREVSNIAGDSKQAEETIMLFLRKVNAAAVNQGILPDPIQGTVGSMAGAELFETINRAKRYTGKIELTAEAEADTYTAGPLRIEIRIKSIP